MVSAGNGQLTNGGFEEIGPDRFPVGWSGFSSDPSTSIIRITTDSVEGRFALYMEATKEGTVGLNRFYRATPGTPTQEIGFLLPFKKGALIFRYKLLKSAGDNVRMYVIPMKDDNVEGGGDRAVYVLPQAFAGDNKWHTGVLAFNYADRPQVARIQIGARINEGGRPGPGAVIFDDLKLVEAAGWHLRLAGIRVDEGIKPGVEGTFSVLLHNTGDAPAPVQAYLTPPAPVRGERLRQPPSIDPGTVAPVSWRLIGSRKTGTRATIQWDSGPSQTETVSHTFSARLDLKSLSFSSAVLFRGARYQLRLHLFNEGDAVLEGLPIRLTVSDALRLVEGPPLQTLPLLTPGATVLSWTVEPRRIGEVQAKAEIGGGPGTFPIGCRALVSQTINLKSQSTLLVSSRKVRLLLPKNDFGYGVISVEVLKDGQWKPMALSPQFLLIRYQDVRRRDITRPITSQQPVTQPDGTVQFPFSWQDRDDGAVWSGQISFRPDGDSIVVSWDVRLDKKKPIIGIQGPVFFVGDNHFGSRKDAALLPGVYWLMKDETSRDIRFTDPPHHLHIVPHPYKLTQPMMVLSEGGAYFGLLWDPLQNWTEGEGQGAQTGLCPQPLFASPNHLSDQDNHLIGLMVPNVPAWLEENKPWATRPITNNAYRLTARIVGGSGDVLSAYEDFFTYFSLPPVPPFQPEEVFTRSQAEPQPPRFGRLLSWLTSARVAALDDVRSQREDGSWGYVRDPNFTIPNLAKFAPHRSLDEYGKEGDTTVGTCTFVNRRAMALLRYARLTGSDWARKAAIKALHFIDRNFLRPEGAQTWEIPLHCPDVLASANAITAYLEGWTLTGDLHYLQGAVYWARTGLPFIYLWHPPDRPTMMLFASIPVFGTSFFTAAPWFGTPVQWNGLDYAYSLLKLAKALETVRPTKDRWFDPQFWRQLAEGITVCGAHMQAAVRHPKGFYPDSVSLTFSYRPNDPGVIPPHGIVRNLWFLLNQAQDPEDYETKVLVQGDASLHITTEAFLQDARLSDGIASFTILSPPTDRELITLVTPLEKPAKVSLAGRELPLLIGNARGPGWRYRADRAMVEIRIAGIQGTVTCVLFGVRIVSPPRERVWERPVWNFDTDDDPEDWTVAYDLTEPLVSNGTMKLTSTGFDPYFHSPPIQVDATSVRTLVIRARFYFPPGTVPDGQVFWIRTDDPNWTESKSLHFPLPTDGQWAEIRRDLSTSPEWKGTVTQIRLDPGSGTGIEVEIDSIRLE